MVDGDQSGQNKQIICSQPYLQGVIKRTEVKGLNTNFDNDPT